MGAGIATGRARHAAVMGSCLGRSHCYDILIVAGRKDSSPYECTADEKLYNGSFCLRQLPTYSRPLRGLGTKLSPADPACPCHELPGHASFRSWFGCQGCRRHGCDAGRRVPPRLRLLMRILCQVCKFLR